MAGFEHLQEGFEKGWYQEDFAADKFERGQELLATGEIAHYPMLTFAVGAIAENYPDSVEDIGFFAQPGNGRREQRCHDLDAGGDVHPEDDRGRQARRGQAVPGLHRVGRRHRGHERCRRAVGSVHDQGRGAPGRRLPAIKDMQPYIDAGHVAPALEFLSPIKGPALEQITVAVGSGINTAEEGADLYDQDVEKQAQQLGLPGW